MKLRPYQANKIIHKIMLDETVKPTEEEIQAKIDELEATEPMILLKKNAINDLQNLTAAQNQTPVKYIDYRRS